MKWIVAASGSSLTPEVAEKCRGHKVIAVNDAWQLLPFADYLYACDAKWWDLKKPKFRGQKWSSHSVIDDKTECAKRHGLNLISGTVGLGFSFTPGLIHYGCNSGFQAVNLALQFGAWDIVLVGFDMRGAHFFGNHPHGLRDPSEAEFRIYIQHFKAAAERLPADIQIVNATPDSALDCFPMMSLEDAL